MYLNIDTEENLALCAEGGEHDNTTGHVLAECPTYGDLACGEPGPDCVEHDGACD